MAKYTLKTSNIKNLVDIICDSRSICSCCPIAKNLSIENYRDCYNVVHKREEEAEKIISRWFLARYGIKINKEVENEHEA